MMMFRLWQNALLDKVQTPALQCWGGMGGDEYMQMQLMHMRKNTQGQ